MLIFSLALAVELCEFSQNKSCKTYLAPMLPSGGRNWHAGLLHCHEEHLIGILNLNCPGKELIQQSLSQHAIKSDKIV